MLLVRHLTAAARTFQKLVRPMVKPLLDSETLECVSGIHQRCSRSNALELNQARPVS